MSADDVAAFADANSISYERVEDQDALVDRAVETIAAGKVIGWYQGRLEWGPRALGNRSIIADPRREEMKDVVNRKIKFREPFRPFAPSVLAERTSEYFSIDDPARHYPSHFMLYITPVEAEARSKIPAVTHVDGTARPQAVRQEANPLYHRLISRFADATGVPVVLNTSFNLRGEPIVNRPDEAYSTFLRSDLDAMAMGPYWFDKKRA